jgi:glutamyl-Q tRNA(Asp) synthetase
LHLGHAYSAILAHDLARASGGVFLLRIEDIDGERCRAEFEAAICEDLEWLGLKWDGPLIRQSERMARYRAGLRTLEGLGVLYPCFCTRSAIAAEIAHMPAAPHESNSPLYPGTCRGLEAGQRAARMTAEPFAWRLDVAAALAKLAGASLTFTETGQGPTGETGLVTADPARLGDVVLGRKDSGVSYQLACVMDDAEQGVTLVSRGEDLFAATHTQRLLQSLLGLATPTYHHHRLIRDPSGRRLAKRDRDLAISAMRASGLTSVEIRARLGLPANRP